MEARKICKLNRCSPSRSVSGSTARSHAALQVQHLRLSLCSSMAKLSVLLPPFSAPRSHAASTLAHMQRRFSCNCSHHLSLSLCISINKALHSPPSPLPSTLAHMQRQSNSVLCISPDPDPYSRFAVDKQCSRRDCNSMACAQRLGSASRSVKSAETAFEISFLVVPLS